MTRRSRVAAITASIGLIAAAGFGVQDGDWSASANLGQVVNSPSGDFFPAISKDGLSLYFTAARPGGFGGWDIYVSQRARAGDPWGLPHNLGPGINTADDEGAPTFSPDGHTMYFASTRPGGLGGSDIYVSRRHNKRDDFGWQSPENLGPGVNSPADESAPSIFEDEASGAITLFFDSNRPGGPGPLTANPGHNGNDIYSSPMLADGAFGPAALVAELSTPFFDRKPAISRDGLTMILSSDRPGTLGDLDLWVSTRSTTADPWSTPLNLGPIVNGPTKDAGAALTFNGLAIYFQSDRPGGVGAYDLYVATRPKHP